MSFFIGAKRDSGSEIKMQILLFGNAPKPDCNLNMLGLTSGARVRHKLAVCVCVCACMYIYLYIDEEREREGSVSCRCVYIYV